MEVMYFDDAFDELNFSGQLIELQIMQCICHQGDAARDQPCHEFKDREA